MGPRSTGRSAARCREEVTGSSRQENQKQIACDSELGRESLYKALSAGAHPRFETINAVLHALGVKFVVVPDRV
jgi:probable addiction module antidote protein